MTPSKTTAAGSRRPASARWTVPVTTSVANLLEALTKDWRCVSGRRTVRRVQYFDTHEWGLYFNDLRLTLESGGLRLAPLEESESGVAPTLLDLDSESPPRFWWEFPQGDLRDALSSRLGLRALIDRGTLRISTLPVDIKNRDDKTVVRSSIESFADAKKPRRTIFRALTARAVRGYDDELTAFESTVAEQLELDTDSRTVFDRLLEYQELVPTPYTSKPKVFIARGESLRETVVAMLRASLELVDANTQGTIDDVDTEFLHHFRTSVRRSRSLLSLVKGALGADIEDRLKSDLRELQQRTNRLRDLDVFLLDQAAFRSLLPASLHPGLAAWQLVLEAQRGQEQKRLARFLRSASFERKMTSMRRQIEQASANDPTATGESPSALAGPEIVLKRYRRVRKRGRAITPSTPDEAIHDLRIDCKKLRYTLEFFESVLPADTLGTVLPRLKKLQDVLGDFNDLAVQQAELRDMFDDLDHGKPQAPEIALALGGLIATLYSRHERQRDKVLANLQGFVGSDIKTAFAQLEQP